MKIKRFNNFRTLFLLIFFSILYLSSCYYNKSSNYVITQHSKLNPLYFQNSWDSKVDLKGGLSKSSLYKVSKDGKFYVVRDFEHRSTEDKIFEIRAQLVASDNFYGPKVYAYDATEGKILMSFLEIIKNDLTPSRKAEKLAKLLLKMHNGPKFQDNFSAFKLTQKLINKKIKVLPKEFSREKLASVLSDYSELPKSEKRPSHRDLNLNNMLYTKDGYKIIDFENASQDDPFFDIATIIIFNFYTSPGEKEFIQQYFKRNLTYDEIARLNTMKKIVFLYYGLSIIKKISNKLIQKKVKDISFNEAMHSLNKNELSLDNQNHLLIIAKSMLNEATK